MTGRPPTCGSRRFRRWSAGSSWHHAPCMDRPMVSGSRRCARHSAQPLSEHCNERLVGRRRCVEFPVQVGTPLAGYAARSGSAVGTLDELVIAALVLEDGSERLVILSADVAAVDAEIRGEIASAVGSESLRARNLCIAYPQWSGRRRGTAAPRGSRSSRSGPPLTIRLDRGSGDRGRSKRYGTRRPPVWLIRNRGRRRQPKLRIEIIRFPAFGARDTAGRRRAPGSARPFRLPSNDPWGRQPAASPPTFRVRCDETCPRHSHSPPARRWCFSSTAPRATSAPVSRVEHRMTARWSGWVDHWLRPRSRHSRTHGRSRVHFGMPEREFPCACVRSEMMTILERSAIAEPMRPRLDLPLPQESMRLDIRGRRCWQRLPRCQVVLFRQCSNSTHGALVI